MKAAAIRTVLHFLREFTTVGAIMMTDVIRTADGKSLCLGLQFVQFEGNPEGRKGLQKLRSVGSTCYEPMAN